MFNWLIIRENRVCTMSCRSIYTKKYTEHGLVIISLIWTMRRSSRVETEIVTIYLKNVRQKKVSSLGCSFTALHTVH